jgi:shikimate kinase
VLIAVFLMNIILIGYRGAGKTTVGRDLSLLLGRKFVDTDEFIEERVGSPIREIVKSRGWDSFRSMEKKVIEEVCREDLLVIAPGGGAVIDGQNVAALKKNGLVIWLNAAPKILGRRISRDPQTLVSRPTLTGKGTLQEFEEILAGRNPLYKKAADAEIDTSTLRVEEVSAKILLILRKKERGSLWAEIPSEPFSK